MNGFMHPPKKRNLSALERKRLNKQARRAKQFVAAMTTGAAFAPEAHASVNDVGSFYAPAVVMVARPADVPNQYVDEVVRLGEPSLPLLIIGADECVVPQRIVPHDRSVSARMEQHRARVATLERVLLRDLERSSSASEADVLHGFALRLTRLAYQANAEEALMQFALGEAYMRSLSDRLAAEHTEDPDVESDFPGFTPFHLYVASADGIGIEPTPEAIEAWEAMRNRLLRGKSELGRRWSSSGSSWSPWYVAPLRRA